LQVIIVSTICDAVSATEGLLCTCTAFEVHCNQGAFLRLERRIVKCAKRYLKTWAAIDVLGALPAALMLFLLLGADNTSSGGIVVVQVILLLKGISALRLWDKVLRWRQDNCTLTRTMAATLICSIFVLHWATCLRWLVSARGPKDMAPAAPAASSPAPPPSQDDVSPESSNATQAQSALRSCLADRHALLYESPLDKQYECALLWAMHVVSLSGGREYSAWGAWERLLAVVSAWVSLLGVGCILGQAWVIFYLSTDSGKREYAGEVARTAADFLKARFREKEKHKWGPVGSDDLDHPWLPPPASQRAILEYLSSAGAHVLKHQRGTSDLAEIRGFKCPADKERITRCAGGGGGGGELGRGWVCVPDPVSERGTGATAGAKARYGWRSWGREEEVEGGRERADDEASAAIPTSPRQGGLLAQAHAPPPRMTASQRVRVFLELHGTHLITVSYLKQAISHAAANVALHRLSAPGLPAQHMRAQHLIDYLLHQLHVLEFRKGDLVVWPGELLHGVSFLVSPAPPSFLVSPGRPLSQERGMLVWGSGWAVFGSRRCLPDGSF